DIAVFITLRAVYGYLAVAKILIIENDAVLIVLEVQKQVGNLADMVFAKLYPLFTQRLAHFAVESLRSNIDELQFSFSFFFLPVVQDKNIGGYARVVKQIIG